LATATQKAKNAIATVTQTVKHAMAAAKDMAETAMPHKSKKLKFTLGFHLKASHLLQ
jgi:hypothetical protein